MATSKKSRWDKVFALIILLQLPVKCPALISIKNEIKSVPHLHICSNESVIANKKTIGKDTWEFLVPVEFIIDRRSSAVSGSFYQGGLQCKFGHFHETFLSPPPNPHTTVDSYGKQVSSATKNSTIVSYGPLSTADNRILLGNLSYDHNEYCVDYLNTTRFSLKVCYKKPRESLNQNCSDTSPCLRKCCKQNETWNISSGSCQRSLASQWTPYFYRVESDCVMKTPLDLHSSENTSESSVRVIDGLPANCLSHVDRHTIPSKNIPGYALGRFRILVNGSVLINIRNGSWQELLMDDFCVDQMILGTHDAHGTHSYAGDVLLVCRDEVTVRRKKGIIPLKYAAMLFGASVILLITAVVYLLLWDKHNVYEWTVFFEVISMLFMIISVAVAHTVARDPAEGHLGSQHCTVIGAVSHFFFLATFFWLFIINFEIWWNFRTLTIRKKKSRRWLRLINYHTFAWGCPLLMVAIGLILDSTYGLQNEEIDCSNIIVPNYGQLNCYISKAAQGPYLYYPIGVLLGFNLLFYTMTVIKMCGYQKNSQSITKNRSNGHFQPVVVFARLFIIQGVSWISEIVAWAVSPKSQGTIPLYWIVFDIVTLVQAIAIFTIFVCRKENLHKLLEKYPSLLPVFRPLTKFSCCALPPPQQTPVQVQRLSLKNAASNDHNKRLQVSPGNVSNSSSVTVIVVEQDEV